MTPHQPKTILALLLCFVFAFRGQQGQVFAQEPPAREPVMAALSQGIGFYRKHVGVNGGSVYRVSADLTKREGEYRVGPLECWIEPPATSSVGMGYLRAWKLTKEPVFYDAMLEVAIALVRGQLVSGGWTENIEFDPQLRPKYAYRVDAPTSQPGQHNRTTFDDNKSQSSLVYLMLIDRELEFQNQTIHEAAMYALEAFTKAQYPNGAWPQQYTDFPDPQQFPVLKARFPESWNRVYERISYSQFYTLNDSTISDCILMMLTAYEIYNDERWLAAAKRGGDFLILAQLPEPQPGWAQQYNFNMEPSWARKFEPPAITGGESQQVMDTLLTLYDRTGDAKYIAPLPRAIEYYQSLKLANGQLARFYEMGTDRPLYFTREYDLVYTDDDVPTHYAFKVGSRLDRIQTRYQKLLQDGPSGTAGKFVVRQPRLDTTLVENTRKILQTQDQRGAWVEKGSLRNFRDDEQVTEIISIPTYTRNILTLAEFLAASKPGTEVRNR